jgi:hypothetical protein
MPRITAIALVLCLSCFASGCSEIAPPREGAEDAPPRVIRPTSFVCDVPGPPSVKAQAPPQPIPPGKEPKDLCPAGANVLFFYDSPPSVSNIPPPPGLDSAAYQPQPDSSKITP